MSSTFHVVPNAELSRTTDVGKLGDVCTGVGPPPDMGVPTCFRRPEREVVAGAGVRFEFASSEENDWHSRMSVGAGWFRSFNDGNLDERRSFVAPEVAVGFASGMAGRSWGFEFRWRGLYRWDLSSHKQWAIRTFLEL